MQPCALLNLRGRPYQHYDGAGVVTSLLVDFKGNMLQSERRLAKAYKTQVDWMALDALDDPAAISFAAGGLLEMEAFAGSIEYDALNRPVSMITPDASEIRPTYNEAGLLDKVEARVRGAAAWTPFVDNIDYDAKGQREKMAYVYDALYRLTSATGVN